MKVLVLVASVILLAAAPALADTKVTPGQTGYLVHGFHHAASSDSSTVQAAQQSDDLTVEENPVCAIGGTVTCDTGALCDNGTPMVTTIVTSVNEGWSTRYNNCPTDAVPAQAQPQLTPGIVATAFRRIPLPAANLVVQPPHGRTLVNFDTNFYTERGDRFTRTVTLLGRRVQLRIWPDTFAWRFGDGATEQSDSPGSPYPDLDITHRYQHHGQVRPSVDVTYAADYRVGNQPWRPVPGTVTIAGAPQQLRVVEARPVLVGS